MEEIDQIEDERNNKSVNEEPEISYYDTQGSNNLIAFYDAAYYLKWWKPIPFVSEVITGWQQFNQDKEMNYSWNVRAKRVLIVMGEDIIVDYIATSAGGLAVALFSESGPSALVAGFMTYYSIEVLSDPFISPINENIVFPFFNVDR